MQRSVKLTSILAMVALTMLLMQSVAFGQDEPKQPAEQGGAIAPAAVLSHAAGAQESVRVVNDIADHTTTATNWTTLPNASTTVLIPANHWDLFIVRFFGESACFGGVGNQFCKVRILIDGVEANPVVGAEFAFDSTDNGAESQFSWEA
jgi:hypothetical protein